MIMTGQQLKNSILQEAIEGRLVPQDPNDEPASVLLERIRAEKARLVKEKKIKKDKNESRIYRTEDGHWMEHFEDKNREDICIDEEIPFDVPSGWEWERWGNISQSIQYGYNAPAEVSGIIRMVRISDIQENKVIWDSVPYCNIKESDIDNYLLCPNDILFARTGGTVGKSFLVKDTPYKAIYAGYLIRTRYSNMLRPEYLKYYMESRLYWEQLRNGTIATAQPNCNGQTLSKMFVPIPPLAEQHRIVEKIESLLPKVEAYGKAQEELVKLTEALPEQLKKSILQEAIEGRLVPQDPNDEPASVLLERIRTEKARLVKEKKIKKDKNESRIYRTDDGYWMEHFEDKNREDICIDEEIPFELPSGWEWCRLGSVTYNHGQKKPNEEFSYIDISSIDNKFQKLNEKENILQAKEAPSRARKIVLHGDVLYATVRPYLHNMCIVDKTFSRESIASTGFAVLCCYNDLYNKFLFYYLLSPIFDSYANDGDNAKGMAYPAINDEKLYKGLVPLPPLAEQHRIVEKIESLLPKIEKLKVNNENREQPR